MYCKKCGKEIDSDAEFCKFCGEKLSSNITNENELTKKQMMNSLKKYKETINCTCLECGYQGLMGVVKKQPLSIGNIIWIIFSSILVLCDTVVVLLYPGIFYTIFDLIMIGSIWVTIVCRKNVLYCPHCGKILNQR